MTTLERPLTLNSGKVLPAGTEVVLLPQTTAHSVLVSADQTLAEAWDGLSKVGHVHEDDQANLVHYASELTRYADRQSRRGRSPTDSRRRRREHNL